MIRYKKRVKKVLWRTGQVKEDAAGMARLRREVYERACGRCEIEWDGKRWVHDDDADLHVHVLAEPKRPG